MWSQVYSENFRQAFSGGVWGCQQIQQRLSDTDSKPVSIFRGGKSLYGLLQRPGRAGVWANAVLHSSGPVAWAGGYYRVSWKCSWDSKWHLEESHVSSLSHRMKAIRIERQREASGKLGLLILPPSKRRSQKWFYIPEGTVGIWVTIKAWKTKGVWFQPRPV